MEFHDCKGLRCQLVLFLAFKKGHEGTQGGQVTCARWENQLVSEFVTIHSYSPTSRQKDCSNLKRQQSKFDLTRVKI